MIIYAIKNLEGNFYNRTHNEFRTLGQDTAFYNTLKLANKEKGFCLIRHLVTQYDKRKDKVKEADYYKELDKYVKEHYKATDVCVVELDTTKNCPVRNNDCFKDCIGEYPNEYPDCLLKQIFDNHKEDSYYKQADICFTRKILSMLEISECE